MSPAMGAFLKQQGTLALSFGAALKRGIVKSSLRAVNLRTKFLRLSGRRSWYESRLLRGTTAFQRMED